MSQEPMTYGDDDEFCDHRCPFFKSLAPADAHCTRDEKPIYFYDWYLAHCKGQIDEPQATT